MNMKLLVGAVFGVLALTHLPSAGATDIKAFHGSGCKVYGTTAWTDLGFGWQGIFNTTATPKVIVCPLIKDSESDWDGGAVTETNAAYIDVHWRTTSEPSSITCTAYTSRTSTLTSARTMNRSLAAQTNDNFDLLDLASSGTPNDVGSIMICNLGAKGVLQHYRLVEPAASDS